PSPVRPRTPMSRRHPPPRLSRPRARPSDRRGSEDHRLSERSSGYVAPPVDSSVSGFAPPSGGPAMDCSPAASSGNLASKAGRSERIRGIRSKLRSGGGDEVAHSSELPWPHGSSTVTSWPTLYDFQQL